MSDFYTILVAFKQHDYTFLLFMCLIAALIWFVRRAWLAFLREMEVAKNQIRQIHALQLELAEISEIDLDHHADVTSHADIIRHLNKLEAHFTGPNWINHAEMMEVLKSDLADITSQLETISEEVGERCSMVDCSHLATMERAVEDIARCLKQYEKSMEEIAKDNKEVGNEFVNFAGALLNVVTKRSNSNDS